MLEATRLLAIESTHFLQTNDVGIKLLYRVAEVMNFQSTRRPKALYAFVDVVGGYTKSIHRAVCHLKCKALFKSKTPDRFTVMM
jgi:hypothetical protein